MRSDYLLYSIAIIFFVLTGTVLAYEVEQKPLWIITTAVLGLLFVAIGLFQRPKTAATPTQAVEAPAPPPSVPAPTTLTEVVKQEAIEVTEPATPAPPTPSGTDITMLKGIKAKRAEQLKALGINNAEDLAKASAKHIATKLDISPKITTKWIENAKELTEKS